MKARRKGSLSYMVLTTLEKAVDGYVSLEDMLYNPGFYIYSTGREVNKSELARAIKRLRDYGLVEKVKLKDDIVLRLTNSAKEISDSGLENKEWDGKWRVVTFDIPEQKRIVRNLFRRNLKKWGFKPLQKSVWISKRDVFEKLDLYVKDLGLEKWVSVIEANKLSQ